MGFGTPGLRVLCASLALVSTPASGATLAPITADAVGNWIQNARNAPENPVADLVVLEDGTLNELGALPDVAPGATVGIPAIMSAGLVSQNVRVVARNAGGFGPISVDVRPVIRAQAPPPPPPSSSSLALTVDGAPATGGPWGVIATTPDTRDVQIAWSFDGVFHHIEHNAPWGFPDDLGSGTAHQGIFGNGSHTVLAVLQLEGTTTEIARASVTVVEGSTTPPPPTPVCGNGVKEGMEVCDGTSGCAAPSACTSNCGLCLAPCPSCPACPTCPVCPVCPAPPSYTEMPACVRTYSDGRVSIEACER